MEYQDLRYEKDGHLLTITLDRETSRNAYSDEMIDSLIRAFDAAEEDDEIRCVIIRGAGKTFSAGGDLKAMQDHTGMFEGDPMRLRTRYLRGIQRIPRRIASFEKPLIAALNGHAIGAGLDLACMCDIRIAAEGASFGSTFVKLGIVPGDGGAYLLARIIGFPRALDLILSGRVIDTAEAERIGLVTQVVPADKLMETVYERARVLAGNPPLAVRMAKSAVYQSWELSLEQSLNLAATYQGIVQNTPDHDEGVRALLEKRAPVFRG